MGYRSWWRVSISRDIRVLLYVADSSLTILQSLAYVATGNRESNQQIQLAAVDCMLGESLPLTLSGSSEGDPEEAQVR